MTRPTLRFPVAALLAAALLAGTAGPAAAITPVSPPTLRLDGIGPLRLGMTSRAALRTGWLARRGTGCKLGGRPYPVTYTLSGRSATAGVVGVAEFQRGKLRNLAFTEGVRTAVGVEPGVTGARAMAAAYRRAGFGVRTQFLDTFGGTFVTVRRGRRQVVGGFATRGTVRTLAIPYVPTCE